MGVFGPRATSGMTSMWLCVAVCVAVLSMRVCSRTSTLAPALKHVGAFGNVSRKPRKPLPEMSVVVLARSTLRVWRLMAGQLKDKCFERH